MMGLQRCILLWRSMLMVKMMLSFCVDMSQGLGMQKTGNVREEKGRDCQE